MKYNKFIKNLSLIFGTVLGITATGATAKANVKPVNFHNNANNYSQYNNDIRRPSKKLIPRDSYFNFKRQKQQVQRHTRLSNPQFHNRVSHLYRHIISNGNNRINHRYHRHNNYGRRYMFRHHSHHNHGYRHHLHDSHLRYIRIDAAHAGNYKRHHKFNYELHKHNHHHHMHHQLTSIYSNNHQRIMIRHTRHHHNWFRDGLNRHNLRARSWVSMHESGHRWNILSYGHVCVGYFQLNPEYLGYRHGHVDLRPKHQVKVADKYVRRRYGNWVNAKRFWEYHHWY